MNQMKTIKFPNNDEIFEVVDAFRRRAVFNAEALSCGRAREFFDGKVFHCFVVNLVRSSFTDSLCESFSIALRISATSFWRFLLAFSKMLFTSMQAIPTEPTRVKIGIVGTSYPSTVRNSSAATICIASTTVSTTRRL